MPAKESRIKPAMETIEFKIPDVDQIYEDMKHAPDIYAEAMRAIESGKEQVHDAVLFCGRFNRSGQLLRECAEGDRPYRIIRIYGHEAYQKAMGRLKECWAGLSKKLKESETKTKEDWDGGFSGGGSGFAAPYISNSDLGSNSTLDPNQFTEFTPWFSGPFYKNIPYAYFPGMAAAREAVNHNLIANRIAQILPQYALGRGFEIRCKNEGIAKKWRDFAKHNKLQHKIRKFWGREYLTDGELTIDKSRMISIDSSTIMDIVCEGWDEFIDKPIFLQQMFQTATQTYSGIDVPGVPKAKETKPGKWIVRQIPADQVIRIKTNCTSQEKRGRPVIFSILGWLKKLKDTYTAQVLSEQLQACFVYDDTIDGSAGDVAAHGAKYNYIPVAPSIFVHNKAVERKALAPAAGKTGIGSSISQEILAFLATAMGFPKDFFNVMASGSGSRATAIVGSEPFTKVIEDLQQDFQDLLDSIIETFCEQNKIEYNEDDWQVMFPSVSKDSAKDYIANVSTAEQMGYINKRRAGTMVAAELECDNYDFDNEQDVGQKDLKKHPPIDIGAPPPAGRFGAAPPPMLEPTEENPIHAGKNKLKSQHKTL